MTEWDFQLGNLDKIGTVDGRAIYADTGEDYTKILLEAIKKKIDAKKVKAGQVFVLPFDFVDEPLIAKIHIKKWNER